MPKTKIDPDTKENVGFLITAIQTQGRDIANTALVELAYLRGYQAGYEDCRDGVKPKHYVKEKS